MGWHSTAEHEPQTTTVCEWLKTVVMLKQPCTSEWRALVPKIHAVGVQGHAPAWFIAYIAERGCAALMYTLLSLHSLLAWHLTSMKKEFGDCTRRLSLCLRFS